MSSRRTFKRTLKRFRETHEDEEVEEIDVDYQLVQNEPMASCSRAETSSNEPEISRNDTIINIPGSIDAEEYPVEELENEVDLHETEIEERLENIEHRDDRSVDSIMSTDVEIGSTGSESEDDYFDHFNINNDQLELNQANNEDDDDDDDLYEGAPITKCESFLAILNFAYRHKITKVLLADLLKLISLHLPVPNLSARSTYKFFQYFEDVYISIIRHYYCVFCYADLENEGQTCECQESSKASYFIEIPVIEQLKRLYKRPGFTELLAQRFQRQDNADYNDVYDGQIYKELSVEGQLLSDPNNISFTWYTDGFKVFKTRYEIWPIYLVINELPYNERMKMENMLLVELWFGEEHPKVDKILQSLYNNLEPLAAGVQFVIPGRNDPITVQAITICGLCDSPAKALFLNMHQFNGEFGCQRCTQKGEIAPGTMNVRCYNCEEEVNLRTPEEHEIYVQQAIDSNGPVYGVKGKSLISVIAYKFLETTVADPMHCVFEGVVAKILNLWFNKTKRHFGFGKSNEEIELVDERLLAMSPPSHIQRNPRSIQRHLVYWKGHEFKNWLFYFSVAILKDIITEREFYMWKLLVLGISLLYSDSVSQNALYLAIRALEEFLRQFQEIFGIRHMTINLHLIRHLSENVTLFGPLWVTSCFPFEDMNGKMKRLVTGTNSPHIQICRSLSAFLAMETLNREKLNECRQAYHFCKNIHYKIGRMKRHEIDLFTYIVGPCIIRNHPANLLELMQNANIERGRVFLFKRLLKNKYLYVSKSYRRARRSINYCTTYLDNDEEKIGIVQYFIRNQHCDCALLCHCQADHYALINNCTVETAFETDFEESMIPHIYKLIHKNLDVEFVNVNNIKTVCFYMPIKNTNQTYIAKPVNSREFE